MKRQQGFSLIELAVSIAIAGVAVGIAAGVVRGQKAQSGPTSEFLARSIAIDSLSGFAYVNGRLPCADTDSDGIENCPSTQGRLPYATLGMSSPLLNQYNHHIHYAAYARSDGSAANDADLIESKDRLKPLIVDINTTVGVNKSFDNRNTLDFCHALATAEKSAVNTSYVHTVYATSKGHPAYLLVDPGRGDKNSDGNLFDGLNKPLTSTAFEHPARPQSPEYDDHVYATPFSEMWGQVGCQNYYGLLAATYPNVVSSVAMYTRALEDYSNQLDLLKEMAGADVDQANANKISGDATVLDAAASAVVAAAAVLIDPSASAGVAGAAVAITAAAIISPLTTADLNEAKEVQSLINTRRSDLDDLIEDFEALYVTLLANADAADRAILSAP